MEIKYILNINIKDTLQCYKGAAAYFRRPNKSVLIILLSLMISPLTGLSQNFYLFGDKTYGGNKAESLGNILLLNDSTLVIGGYTNTNVNGDKTDSLCGDSIVTLYDSWLLKIDTAFNVLWQKDLGGNRSDVWPWFKRSNNDSQVLFSISSESDSSCEKSEDVRSPQEFDYWTGVLDSDGNVVWEKTYGGLGIDLGCKIIELTSGEFIICGESDSPIGADKTVVNYGGRDYWILKLDTLGNKIWDKVFGGSGYDWAQTHLFDLIATDDNGLILAGTTASPLSGTISEISRGSQDIWIAKIDNAGNQIWDRRYGGTSYDYAKRIIQTHDNSYLICGTTNSPQGLDVSEVSLGDNDFWIIKVDSVGNKIWDKRYGGTGKEIAMWVEQDFDGSFWIGGTVEGDSSIDVSEQSYGLKDYWILKVDSIGNKLWDKRFGGPGQDVLTSFVILPDSSLMLFGWADSGISAVKTDIGKGLIDYWLVHFKYGNIPTGTNEIHSDTNSLSIFPNPANDFITIKLNDNVEFRHFLLHDATGRTVLKKLISKSITIDISNIPPGIYFYEVREPKGEKVFGKLVKI